jgi:dihydropteroate synthase-like protein
LFISIIIYNKTRRMKKQKTLIVTGRNASSAVERYAKSAGIPVRVHVCDIDVASLLSPERVLDELSKLDLRDISRIIVPGALEGDVSIIRERLGVPCFKGSRHVSDLPLVLSGDVALSEKLPADEVLAEEIKGNVERELRRAYESTGDYRLKIGRKKTVFLGAGLMHVIAEIPDAPSLGDEEIKRISRYYVDSGASIIDLGMVYGVDNSDEIGRLVDAVRSAVDSPVSIDSLDEGEILAAVDSGIDLILSLDLTNYPVSESIDIPAVVIPRDEGGIPRTVDERIDLMEKLIQKLRDRDFNGFIVDMVLEPPNLGFLKSLQAFHVFRSRYPEIPMMLGSGNVTELLDADSIGVNALLASLASELDVDLLFTTEASQKTKGVVSELSRAVEMMYLSRSKERPPKDLGIDLLRLKDKREIEMIRNPREESLEKIEVKEERKPTLEDAEFRIYLLDKIEVVYYRNKKPKLKFRGVSARGLYLEIIQRGLIRNPEHAAYLGREMGKAEIAFKTGKNYVQDEDLF